MIYRLRKERNLEMADWNACAQYLRERVQRSGGEGTFTPGELVAAAHAFDQNVDKDWWWGLEGSADSHRTFREHGLEAMDRQRLWGARSPSRR